MSKKYHANNCQKKIQKNCQKNREKICFRIRFTNMGDDFAKTTQLSSSRIVVFHMTKLRQLPKAIMEVNTVYKYNIY